MNQTDFRYSLKVLNLEQYHDLLVAEAFDSWPVLAQITERDLDTLNVRLGHRRILQQAIAKYQQSNDQIDAQPVRSTTERTFVALAPYPSQPSGNNTTRIKRKYTRHPKDDENAPKPAPTGYVLFSNACRKELAPLKLDFPQIAKKVGDRWQTLPDAEKEFYISQSKDLKTQYLRKMADYKRTPEYREYRRYLDHFKARNSGVAHSRVGPRSPGYDQTSADGSPNASRSRSESTAGEQYGGEWSAVDLPHVVTPHAQSHCLPSMQVQEHNSSPRALKNLLLPSPGHAHFGSLARLPPTMAHQPPLPSNDRCLQPPADSMSSRQLPPLVVSFRS